MSEDAVNLIEFHSGVKDLTDPAPYRALRAVPEWFKQMPAETEVQGVGKLNTIKMCAPFVDAMTCGYIIPLRATVRFFMRDPERLEYDQPEFKESGQTVTVQPAVQYQGAPFGRILVAKFINHWIVKTPPGYSALFLPLLNQFTMPFQALSGMVDSDTYYRAVYFPALCLMQPGSQVVLEKGTPLVQVIPVKRDIWESKSVSFDPQSYANATAAALVNPHHYRDQNWGRKEYR